MKNELEGKLALLREEYQAKLPSKVDEITQIWEKTIKAPNEENISQLHLKVHSLHGTTGTYGFEKIAKIAGKLENLINVIRENPDKITDNVPLIEQGLNELKTLSAGKIRSEHVIKKNETDATDKNTKLIYILDNDKSYELVTQLTTFGYQVEKINDVETFFTEFNKKPAAVLIININLVDEKLQTVLNANDKKTDHTKIPVIFISSNGEFSQRLKAVRLGGEGFFIKPFKIDDLLAQLDRLTKTEKEVYRILIVDDEIEVAKYNAAILEQAKMKTSIITQPHQIDKALHEFSPDLIVIDINMPECNGLELAKIIRQQPIFQSTPIIYLSTESDQLKQMDAMKLGADDFVTKADAVNVLVTIIKNRIARYQKLRSLLVRDNLTGLYDHNFMQKQLEIELKESISLHNPLSIALIDLDKFKTINDTYGYQAGDHVLKSLGLMINKRLRPNDIVGRYTGAKFLVIMPNTSLEAAKTIIDDLRKQFLTLNYSWNQQMFNASFSAGIASFPEFHTAQELLEAVDESMSKAKRSGINKVEIAH